MPDFGDGSGRDATTGTVDPYAPSVANGQISPEQWAAYQKKRKRDAILGMLVATLGGTAALGAAGNVLGGAGAASPSASATGALPAIEGGAPWAVTPYASAASMNAPGAIGAAAGGGGLLNNIVDNGKDKAGGILGGMSGTDLAAIAAGLTGTVGGALAGGKTDTGPSTATTDPALANLLNMQTKRMNQQQPLYDSILQLAMGLMPTNVQRPLNGGGGGM